MLAEPGRARSAEVVRRGRREGVTLLELGAFFFGRFATELRDRFRDLRSCGAVTRFMKIAANVRPWAKHHALLALGVTEGVLHEIDGGADEWNFPRGDVRLGAAQEYDLSLHVDVHAPCAIGFALPCRRREHEGDACRAIRLELGISHCTWYGGKKRRRGL